MFHDSNVADVVYWSKICSLKPQLQYVESLCGNGLMRRTSVEMSLTEKQGNCFPPFCLHNDPTVMSNATVLLCDFCFMVILAQQQ